MKGLTTLEMNPRLNIIRNIGFIAHIDAGKTTTTERILFYSGKTYKIGEVHEGTTTTDWMDQEKERGITITSAATHCKWKDFQINIIDTPGHIDFTVEVERSLKVLDGVVVIFCGVGGVEPQSETVWHQADKYKVPRIAFINKMDRPGADFFTVVDEMKDKLQMVVAPIQIPIFEKDEFIGMIDLIRNKFITYEDKLGEKIIEKSIPEDFKLNASKYRDNLLEKLSELDDLFMHKVIENAEISEEEINFTIRKYVILNKFVPVLCGSSLRNKGVQKLLDAIGNYLPYPSEVNGEEIAGLFDEKSQKDGLPLSLCSICFKVFTDPFVGKLFYTRIYSGKISTSSQIFNSSKQQKEKVTKILRMHANKQEVINEAKAGDIVCLVGLKNTTTGDTLCESNNQVLIEEIKFPEPVVALAIEPKTQSDQDKLFVALTKLSEEDPSFKVAYNKETGQNIISGMGQLHLEIMVDRLIREFNVKAKVGKPQVA
ncbi:MAG: elongation factor G, partial [Candidatus Omnitrophica bacterium]|nr:elongation factor G [Candidatus Omnitrophota bacterium]